MQKTIAGGNIEPTKLPPPPPQHQPSPPLFRNSLLSPLLIIALILSGAASYISAFFYHYLIGDTIPLPTEIGGECDIFSGRWVRDYNRPLYEESDCPYIGGQLTCHEHGRPDKDYQYWRWQPYYCVLPSFNATLMLEELRGKRMIFVGDSLNRGQFTSLVCLLQRVIPQNARSMETIDSLTIFTAKDYNARIEYYWMPFLVESNADDPDLHVVRDRVIRNAPIGKHGQHWLGADIILFNTYIWWAQGVEILLSSSLDDEVKNTVKVSMEDGYGMAINMFINWVNQNINPNKTRVFFVGFSATHNWSYKWGGASKGNCYNETTMIDDPTFMGAESSLISIMEEELSKSKVPITFLNITQLTSPRKDAHTSIYKARRRPLTDAELADPMPYADCIHWCLPGVQDVWNELLFTKLF